MHPTLKLCLGLLGAALSLLGFYVRSASSFWFVQSIIAPSYVDAKVAIDVLEKQGSVGRNLTTFSSLADVIEDRAATLNPGVPRSAIVLDWLETTGRGDRIWSIKLSADRRHEDVFSGPTATGSMGFA
jgi:hypothetical protein